MLMGNLCGVNYRGYVARLLISDAVKEEIIIRLLIYKTCFDQKESCHVYYFVPFSQQKAREVRLIVFPDSFGFFQSSFLISVNNST